MHCPDGEERGEAQAEGQEAVEARLELGEGLRHLQRDDEEGRREGEDGVRERLDAEDLPPAQTEPPVERCGRSLGVSHGRGDSAAIPRRPPLRDGGDPRHP